MLLSRLWDKNDVCIPVSNYLLLAVVFLISFSVSLMSIVFVAMMLVALFEGDIKSKWKRYVASDLTWVCLMVFSLVILASFYSESTWKNSVYAIKKYFWLFYLPVLLAGLEIKIQRRYILNVFIAGVVVAVLVAFVNYAYWFDFTPHGRITTFFQDKIKHAYLVILALVLVVNAIRLKQQLVINSILFLLFVANLTMITGSRTGYLILGFVFLMTFGYGLRHRYMKYLLFAGIILGVLLVNISNFGYPRMQQVVTAMKAYNSEQLNKTSFGIRADQWVIGYKAFLKKPVFGYGTGSAGEVINKTQHELIGESLYNHDLPPLVDCGFVNIMVQWGVVGIVCFFMLFAVFLAKSQCFPDNYRFVYLNTVIILFMGNFINNWLATSIPTHMFCLVAACTHAIEMKSSHESI